MHIIVGSGPSGVSAAKALLAKGLHVTMIDTGYTLEPENARIVETIRDTPPARWTDELLDEIREKTKPDSKGVPKKLVYGSDYPFRSPSELLDIKLTGTDVLVSHARGGLSNVWGANFLPLLDNDLDGWPIKSPQLEPYYRKILGFVSLSARDDRLRDLFPLYTEKSAPLPLSRQASTLLEDLERDYSSLAAQGIYFGASRLAVRSTPSSRDSGCVACGQCLYGCPYGLIYSSSFTVDDLLRDDRFKYVPGYFVEKVHESDSGVRVLARDLRNLEVSSFEGERVYIAAGAISSSRIALESMELFDTEITIRESQYYLLPFLRYFSSGNVTKEHLHTLSQICLEVIDPEISRYSIHSLVYTYNDLVLRALKKMFGPLFFALKPFSPALLTRLLVLQGYLHSEDSPSIAMSVSRAAKFSRTVSLEARENTRTKGVIKKLIAKFTRNRKTLKGIPLTPMLHVGAPGKSYHTGASFPMRDQPGAMETDILGRPRGFSRMHMVDTAVLSSIPSTNVTLTIMANAFRIADQST